MLCAITRCCLAQDSSGSLIGLGFFLPLFVREVCVVGLFLWVRWFREFAFLGTLHWPAAGADLSVGGVSYVEMLTSYELWAGERLVLEKVVPRCRTPGRPMSVSARH